MGAPFWAAATLVAGTLLLGLDAERYLQRPALAAQPTTAEFATVVPAAPSLELGETAVADPQRARR
jgi:hypothetical protein